MDKFIKFIVFAAALLFAARGGHASGAVNVVLGDWHTCALKQTGRVACWGSTVKGQLGPVSGRGLAWVDTPLEMESVHDVVALAAKANDTCVVFHDGGAMCFGENSENPRRRLDGIQDAVDVTIGRGHACVLRSTGRVACWGDNNYGQLGLGNNTPMSIPTAVLGLADVVAVKAGDFHTCARILNGSVYCWGLNSSGQLGTGNTTNENFPHLVPGVVAASLSLGSGHTCVGGYTLPGQVRCWGNNSYGQFGNNSTNSSLLATDAGVSILVASQSAGYAHGCFLGGEGAAYCAGWNEYGRLGCGSNSLGPFLDLRRVMAGETRALSNVAKISAGVGHTCAIKYSGEVYCWGNNSEGQLGNGERTLEPSIFARFVIGLDDVIFKDGIESY